MSVGTAGQLHRIEFLDGLRGVAITLVLVFHYIGLTYSNYLPYGRVFSCIPFFNRGWVGVFLFFLISGYVIFLTLEKCQSAADFFRRRWLRLFPAMLFASILIYGSSQLFGTYMPHGSARPADLLPGLSFVGDSFWHAAFHQKFISLDGVFWTLYVECGFYVVIGTLYFWMDSRRALISIIILWIFVISAGYILPLLPSHPIFRILEPFIWLGVPHYGWFAAGALFYKAKTLESSSHFSLAIFFAVVAAMTYTNVILPGMIDRAMLLGCVALFAAAQRVKKLQSLLSVRILLFLGQISYALYLLHNEMGIAFMGAVATYLPKSLWMILPIVTTLMMLALSWFVTKDVEPRIRNLLKPLVGFKRLSSPASST